METEIKKGRGRPRFDISDETKAQIVSAYNSGASIKEVSGLIGPGVVIIKRILTERGVTIRSGKKMA